MLIRSGESVTKQTIYFDLKKKEKKGKKSQSAAGSKSIPDCSEQDEESPGTAPFPHALHFPLWVCRVSAAQVQTCGHRKVPLQDII